MKFDVLDETAAKRNEDYFSLFLKSIEEKYIELENMKWDALRYKMKKYFIENRQRLFDKGIDVVNLSFIMSVPENDILDEVRFIWKDQNINLRKNQTLDDMEFEKEMFEDKINQELSDIVQEVMNVIPSQENPKTNLLNLDIKTKNSNNDIEKTVDSFFSKFLNKNYKANKEKSILNHDNSTFLKTNKKKKIL